MQKKQNLPTILIENDSARCSDGRLEPIPHTHTLHERPLLAVLRTLMLHHNIVKCAIKYCRGKAEKEGPVFF